MEKEQNTENSDVMSELLNAIKSLDEKLSIPAITSKEHYTVDDVVLLTGYSKGTLEKMISYGTFPSNPRKKGSKVFISRQSFNDWCAGLHVDKQTVNATEVVLNVR